MSLLDKLGKSVNILNKFFKHKIVGELWEIEKFSLKESQNELDVERPTMLLWDLTQGMVTLE